MDVCLKSGSVSAGVLKDSRTVRHLLLCDSGLCVRSKFGKGWVRPDLRLAGLRRAGPSASPAGLGRSGAGFARPRQPWTVMCLGLPKGGKAVHHMDMGHKSCFPHLFIVVSILFLMFVIDISCLLLIYLSFLGILCWVGVCEARTRCCTPLIHVSFVPACVLVGVSRFLDFLKRLRNSPS